MTSDQSQKDEVTRSWSERNQRWLSQRFARWRGRLEQRATADGEPVTSEPLEEASDADCAPLALAELFGLSVFERELLVLAAGVDIDSGLRCAVAQAQGMSPDVPVRLSFALALSLLPDPHWDALSPMRPLRHWSLIEVNFASSVDQAHLRVEERVLHYLTGVTAGDERLAGIARLDHVAPDPTLVGLASRVSSVWRDSTEPVIVVLTNATRDAAHRSAARALTIMAFLSIGLRTLWVDAAAFVATFGDPRDAVAAARRIDREAALVGAGVMLALDAQGSTGLCDSVVRLIGSLRSPVSVLGAPELAKLAELIPQPTARFDVPPPDATPRGLSQERQREVRRALEQFRVGPAAVEQALASAVNVEDDALAGEFVWDTLRESTRGGLDTLAQRIASRATLDDLVVPPALAAQLREIANQLKHRHTVYDEWGFAARHSRGLGIAALFSGESGTGKTLAAEAIANEARLDLYRIDLASVVNKYIGETEKNLARLFDAAEYSGAVLLFDEADALFGKRSEVKDSHDRYANIEVAYLLQRVETYRGLAILTTNLRSAVDRSFLRRLRFVVQFPFPDVTARAEIWRRSFPPQAPVGALDWDELARLQLSGGNIRGIALNAAFRAAQRGGVIEQDDVTASARAEFSKLERAFNGARNGAKCGAS